MNDTIVSAKKLRQSQRQHYHIDHVVELQLIAAVLIENDICDPEHENHMTAAAKFAKYFNKRSNLQIIPDKENRKKCQAVSEYLRWKYDEYPRKPQQNVLDEIEEIFQYYRDIRQDVLDDINNDEMGHRTMFRVVENSLFSLLKFRNRPHPRIQFQDIFYESHQLYQFLQHEYDLDHIVEYQIISCVLSENNVTDIHLAHRFASYFNEDWNLQIMSMKRNNDKGQSVQQWLETQFGESDIRLQPHVKRTIDFISRCYKGSRKFVQEDIENDQSLNNGKRNLFRKLEIDLYNLLCCD